VSVPLIPYPSLFSLYVRPPFPKGVPRHGGVGDFSKTEHLFPLLYTYHFLPFLSSLVTRHVSLVTSFTQQPAPFSSLCSLTSDFHPSSSLVTRHLSLLHPAPHATIPLLGERNVFQSPCIPPFLRGTGLRSSPFFCRRHPFGKRGCPATAGWGIFQRPRTYFHYSIPTTSFPSFLVTRNASLVTSSPSTQHLCIPSVHSSQFTAHSTLTSKQNSAPKSTS